MVQQLGWKLRQLELQLQLELGLELNLLQASLELPLELPVMMKEWKRLMESSYELVNEPLGPLYS